MFLFASLLENAQAYLPNDQLETLANAYLVAANAHEEQMRSSGDPYISHPVAVATILAARHMDVETLCAALLHDVIEDTDITRAELAESFGEKIAELVEGVTKLTQLDTTTKAEAQADNFRKMMLAMVRDIRVVLIKLADRMHNMQTLGPCSRDKRRRVALETLDIYVPIANRLGMNRLKRDYEEYGFQALYPMRYRVLKACVEKARGNRKKLLEKIQHTLVEKLKEEGIPENHIWGREKRLYSIFKKMRYRGLPFSEIMDVYGFRVITQRARDCYTILGVVHSLYRPVPGRFKDYIAIPKANGYQSLHTTLFGPYGVPIEIQIRTEEMEYHAEHGIAAHWLYKSDDDKVSPVELRTRAWLKRVLDMQERSGSALEFIENMKIDLYPDDVYVFTPTGEIMELPKGATAVDFAYTVHTEIGHHAVAAKVNRRLVPLSEVLESGQTVEIVTADHAGPNPSWLNFVVTGKAKGAIRHYLKSAQEAHTVSLGRKLLNYALSEYGLRFDDVPQSAFDALLAEMSCTAETLFERIGMGECASAVIAHQLLDFMDTAPTDLESSEVSFMIDGPNNEGVTFPACCYPIPGDEIRGILQKGRGIQVHRDNCPQLQKYGHAAGGDQFVPVEWSPEVSGQFLAEIKIDIENSRGTIAAIASKIAKEDANIFQFHVDEVEHAYGVLSVILHVTSRVHLARILRRVRTISSVMRIVRIAPG